MALQDLLGLTASHGGQCAGQDKGFPREFCSGPGGIFRHVDTSLPQAVHNTAVCIGLEKIHNFHSHFAADVINFCQLLFGSLHKGVHAAKVGGQYFSPVGSYQRNSQGKNHLGERPALGILYSVYEVIHRFFAHFFEPDQVFPTVRNMVDIHNGVDQFVIQQLSYHRRTHAVDIHGISGGEMNNLAKYLGRTVHVQALSYCLTGHPVGFGAADRAMDGHGKNDLSAGALLWNGMIDFGDNISGLLNHDLVANPDILVDDVVLVMEGRPGDHGACQQDRLKLCHRRQSAGTAHLHRDVPHSGHGLLGRELVSNGPAG